MRRWSALSTDWDAIGGDATNVTNFSSTREVELTDQREAENGRDQNHRPTLLLSTPDGRCGSA